MYVRHSSFTGRWCVAKFNNNCLVRNSWKIHLQGECGWLSWNIFNGFSLFERPTYNHISTPTIWNHWCKYTSGMHRILCAQGNFNSKWINLLRYFQCIRFTFVFFLLSEEDSLTITTNKFILLLSVLVVFSVVKTGKTRVVDIYGAWNQYK